MAARPAHAATRLMMTERQDVKETAARSVHAATRLMMTERRDAKEMAARSAHAATLLMTWRQDGKEMVTQTPQPTLPSSAPSDDGDRIDCPFVAACHL
jgi:hypothetical protein